MIEKEHPVSYGGAVSTFTPHPKVYNWVGWSGAALFIQPGRCGAADSLAVGYSGSRGSCLALVPLFGVLLTVHHIPDPKVTSHHEVKTTICACVALRVAEVVVCDAHSHRAVERWIQSGTRKMISTANQLWSSNRFKQRDVICILTTISACSVFFTD